LKEHQEQKGKEIDPADAKMTFGQAATLHVKRLEEKVPINRRTLTHRKETLAALLKSWPALSTMEVRANVEAMPAKNLKIVAHFEKRRLLAGGRNVG
jgi:hypothetical protein